MSKKNIFLLAAGYVAGGIISSLYGKKKPGELKKELEATDKEGDFKLIVNNLIDTHQNLLEDLKTQVMTEKNKALFNEKKEDLLKVVDVYKQQGENLVDELKTKGKDFIVEASENLEKLYEEKKNEIEELKEAAPEKAKEFKEGIKEAFSDVKEKTKSKK